MNKKITIKSDKKIFKKHVETNFENNLKLQKDAPEIVWDFSHSKILVIDTGEEMSSDKRITIKGYKEGDVAILHYFDDSGVYIGFTNDVIVNATPYMNEGDEPIGNQMNLVSGHYVYTFTCRKGKLYVNVARYIPTYNITFIYKDADTGEILPANEVSLSIVNNDDVADGYIMTFSKEKDNIMVHYLQEKGYYDWSVDADGYDIKTGSIQELESNDTIIVELTPTVTP